MGANKYPGTCTTCGERVAAGAGVLLRTDKGWSTAHPQCAPAPVVAPPGDHDGWHRRPMLGFDLETTSAEPETARILTAAIVHSDGTAQRWVANPGVPIPPEASQVNGLTDEYVQAHGRPPAEVLTGIAAVLARANDDGTPVVAFRAAFDCTVLDHELRRHGLPAPRWDACRVIDPAVLDRQIDKWRSGSRTLGATCATYGVDLDNAHEATADARAALSLAVAIGARDAQLAALDAAELHRAQIDWYAADRADLQSYFDRRGTGEQVRLGWPLMQPA